MAELITADMFTSLFAEVKECIPIVLPAVIGFLGLRKAWAFVMGAIHGA